jgi:hypothetical protein
MRVPAESRRGCWSPRNWRYRWMWAVSQRCWELNAISLKEHQELWWLDHLTSHIKIAFDLKNLSSSYLIVWGFYYWYSSAFISNKYEENNKVITWQNLLLSQVERFNAGNLTKRHPGALQLFSMVVLWWWIVVWLAGACSYHFLLDTINYFSQISDFLCDYVMKESPVTWKEHFFLFFKSILYIKNYMGLFFNCLLNH